MLMNFTKMLQNSLKNNNNAVLAINRLQERGFDSQQAYFWVVSRVMEGLDPLDELQEALHSKN